MHENLVISEILILSVMKFMLTERERKLNALSSLILENCRRNKNFISIF